MGRLSDKELASMRPGYADELRRDHVDMAIAELIERRAADEFHNPIAWQFNVPAWGLQWHFADRFTIDNLRHVDGVQTRPVYAGEAVGSLKPLDIALAQGHRVLA